MLKIEVQERLKSTEQELNTLIQRYDELEHHYELNVKAFDEFMKRKEAEVERLKNECNCPIRHDECLQCAKFGLTSTERNDAKTEE